MVLAADARHFYDNLGGNNPFPVLHNLHDYVTGWQILERLADSPQHIVPGHHPLVMDHLFDKKPVGGKLWVPRSNRSDHLLDCTEAPTFAAERHQMLRVAAIAAHSQEAMLEAAALVVILELAFDIPRQLDDLRRQVRLERWVGFLNELIKEGALRAMARIAARRLLICTEN